MSDTIVGKLISKKERKMGSKSAARAYLGIPLPPLTLQYLFCSNVFLLNKLMLLYGPKDSCKTSLGLWFAKNVIDHGGHAVWLGAEHKFVQDIANSMVGPNFKDNDQFHYQSIFSLEEMKESVLEFVNDIFKKGNMKARDKNINRGEDDEYEPETPGIIIVDTLASCLPGDEKDRVHKGKDARVASLAGAITNFLHTLQGDLVDSSCSVLLLNQERPGVGLYAKRSTPGGTAQKFYSTLSLRLKDNDQRDLKTYTEKTVKGEVDKNDAGISGRKVDEISFKWDKENNFWFDFAKADCQLLYDYVDDLDLGEFQDMKRHRGITTYSSDSLELDHLRPNEFIQAIRERNEVMNKIRKEFTIHERPILNSEMYENDPVDEEGETGNGKDKNMDNADS